MVIDPKLPQWSLPESVVQQRWVHAAVQLTKERRIVHNRKKLWNALKNVHYFNLTDRHWLERVLSEHLWNLVIKLLCRQFRHVHEMKLSLDEELCIQIVLFNSDFTSKTAQIIDLNLFVTVPDDESSREEGSIFLIKVAFLHIHGICPLIVDLNHLPLLFTDVALLDLYRLSIDLSINVSEFGLLSIMHVINSESSSVETLIVKVNILKTLNLN